MRFFEITNPAPKIVETFYNGSNHDLQPGVYLSESKVAREIPKVLYHVVGSNYHDGDGLKSLYKQHKDDAYDIFDSRWPDNNGLGHYHAHYIFFYDNLEDAQEHAMEFGGKILAVDPRYIDDLKFDMLEKPGYWVTSNDVPPIALRTIESINEAVMVDEIQRSGPWNPKITIDKTLEHKSELKFLGSYDGVNVFNTISRNTMYVLLQKDKKTIGAAMLEKNHLSNIDGWYMTEIGLRSERGKRLRLWIVQVFVEQRVHAIQWQQSVGEWRTGLEKPDE